MVSPDASKPQAPDLHTKLVETIKDYQKLRSQKLSNGEDTSIIDNLIITLKSQIKSLQNNYVKLKREKPFEERCEMGLHDIFLYYAKQQSMLGKTPTFEIIQKNLETLTLGKFLRFCRDFEIMESRSLPDKKVLTRDTCQKIFIKNAILQKEMEEPQFLKAIKDISDVFFDKEFDKINKTDISKLPSEQKIHKIFELLGCHDSNFYSKKLKGFLVPFGSSPNNRIPDDDLSKKYKPKARRSPDSIYSSNTVRKIDRPEKRFKDNIFLTQKYHRAPSDAIVALSPNKLNIQSSFTYSKKAAVIKSRNPFTWQGLGEMTADQLKDEENFDINELIVEEDCSEDEYVDKKYPLTGTQSMANLKSPKISAKFSKKGFFSNKGSNNKKMNKSENISEKTLRRGNELLEAAKIEEDEHMKRILKIADAQLQKAQNYAAKLKHKYN